MCGIVGYLGEREAYPILIKGLKRLEYRGYDSSGVAIHNNKSIDLILAQQAAQVLGIHVGQHMVSQMILMRILTFLNQRI